MLKRRMSTTFTINVNLKLTLNLDGRVENVEQQPFIATESQCSSPTLTLTQSCPGCFQQILLNIIIDPSLKQAKEVPMDYYEPTIKEEIVDLLEIKEEQFSEAPICEEPQEKVPPDYICAICDVICTSSDGLRKHKSVCLQQEEIICYQCHDLMPFSKRSDFYEHCKEEHGGRLSCALCKPNAFFTDPSSWFTHMAVHKRDYKCKECGKQFLSSKDYHAHVQDHYKGEMICKFCDDLKIFEFRSEFREHLKNVHKYAKFPCPYCHQEYDAEMKLNIHLVLGHWKVSRSCKFCKVYFDTITEREKHLETCEAKKKNEVIEVMYSCKNCDKVYRSKETLVKHGKVCLAQDLICYQCSDEPRFKTRPKFYEHCTDNHAGNMICHLCSPHANFNVRRTWIIHMQAHEKSQQCKYCSQTFVFVKDLSAHEEDHYKEEMTCKHCGLKFDRRIVFREHMKAKHKNLKFMCGICDEKSFETEKNLNLHMVWYHWKQGSTDPGESPELPAKKTKLLRYECEKCQLKFLQRREYQAHVDDHYRGEMMCKFCKATFNLRSEFVEHLQTVHDHTSFPCPFCDTDAEFDTEAKLFMHTHQVHWSRKLHFCMYCSVEFDTAEEKDKHSRTCESRETTIFTCDMCPKQYNRKNDLQRHVNYAHDTTRQTYCCHECGKTFKKPMHLNAHMERHEIGFRPYECHHCGKMLATKKTILRHIQLMHFPAELLTAVCDLCDEKFATDRLLYDHRKRAHEENVACEVCGVMIKGKSSMRIHLKLVHTKAGSSKTFHCNECDFSTSRKVYLRRHKMTHLNEEDRRYRCKVCNKGYNMRCDLVRHELVHTDVRPFVCDECGRGFINKGDWKTHARLHTGDKPYECSVCQMKFSDRGCHRSHMVKHEKEMNVTLDKSVRKKKVVIG